MGSYHGHISHQMNRFSIFHNKSLTCSIANYLKKAAGFEMFKIQKLEDSRVRGDIIQ